MYPRKPGPLTMANSFRSLLVCRKTPGAFGAPNRACDGSSRFSGPVMKTFTATPTDIQHDWYVVDAEGMV
ncbi:MAG TPA: hypothetical protein VHM30_16285, partial [Gemmatimonadaceae bacterium]|nr:hypothetical protein [Gemmatimonadaceae bacterium]